MKPNETNTSKSLIKNGKFFLPPPGGSSDFKDLFKSIAAAGAGRPADTDGFPTGPWTAELLAEAISQISGNRGGVDLRTVQLWFQDNEKGISTENIRWLARVLGCDEPTATSDWQKELSAAQSRLRSKRRKARAADDPSVAPAATPPAFSDDRTAPSDVAKADPAIEASPPGFNLARKMEAYFCDRSPLDLPCFVFAGAVSLGFLSYIFNIDSIVFTPEGQKERQVGFLWAPNWTILFLVILPLFLALVGDMLLFWKEEGRSRLITPDDKKEWLSNVGDFSQSYWAAFFVCIPIAFLFQWIDVCLIPLLSEDPGSYAIDWGKIAIMQPDMATIPESIAFTGLAYMYMGACFFLFFSGLILTYTLVYDLWKLSNSMPRHDSRKRVKALSEISVRFMCGVFRCSLLGVLMAICMKLQSLFMLSGAGNIVDWLIDDFLAGLRLIGKDDVAFDYSSPTIYSSLLIVLATCSVFMYASIRINGLLFGLTEGNDLDCAPPHFAHLPFRLMTGVMLVLVASYISIGAFPGFAILLAIGILLSIYCLFDPGFRHIVSAHDRGQHVP